MRVSAWSHRTKNNTIFGTIRAIPPSALLRLTFFEGVVFRPDCPEENVSSSESHPGRNTASRDSRHDALVFSISIMSTVPLTASLNSTRVGMTNFPWKHPSPKIARDSALISPARRK
jgi:hypothetical protein